jgi:hypothetical protein
MEPIKIGATYHRKKGLFFRAKFQGISPENMAYIYIWYIYVPPSTGS